MAMTERHATIDPDDLRIDLDLEIPVSGADHEWEGVIATWHASIAAQLNPDDDVWNPTQIGRANGYLIGLEDWHRTRHLMDAHDADLSVIAEYLLEREELDLDNGVFLSHLIVIDRVIVDEPFRSQQIGPRAVASVVASLAQGRIAASALVAQPLNRQSLVNGDAETIQRRIIKTWAEVGYEQVGSEVMWLDATDFEVPNQLGRRTP